MSKRIDIQNWANENAVVAGPLFESRGIIQDV